MSEKGDPYFFACTGQRQEPEKQEVEPKKVQ